MGLNLLKFGILSSRREEAGYGGIDENTVLMLHCNGADESTVFTDASPSEHGNATVVGTAQVDTDNKKWGTGSLMLDGDSDCLTYGDSTDWDICGSLLDTWTIDFWIKLGADKLQYFLVQRQDINNYWQLYININGSIDFTFKTGGSEHCYANTPASAVTANGWHHIALIKKEAVAGIYIDGVQKAYDTVGGTGTNTGDLDIGQKGNDTVYLNGYMDEIRIQHSNYFEANPNDTPNDTIDIPTAEYSE